MNSTMFIFYAADGNPTEGMVTGQLHNSNPPPVENVESSDFSNLTVLPTSAGTEKQNYQLMRTKLPNSNESTTSDSTLTSSITNHHYENPSESGYSMNLQNQMPPPVSKKPSPYYNHHMQQRKKKLIHNVPKNSNTTLPLKQSVSNPSSPVMKKDIDVHYNSNLDFASRREIEKSSEENLALEANTMVYLNKQFSGVKLNSPQPVHSPPDQGSSSQLVTTASSLLSSGSSKCSPTQHNAANDWSAVNAPIGLPPVDSIGSMNYTDSSRKGRMMMRRQMMFVQEHMTRNLPPPVPGSNVLRSPFHSPGQTQYALLQSEDKYNIDQFMGQYENNRGPPVAVVGSPSPPQDSEKGEKTEEADSGAKGGQSFWDKIDEMKEAEAKDDPMADQPEDNLSTLTHSSSSEPTETKEEVDTDKVDEPTEQLETMNTSPIYYEAGDSGENSSPHSDNVSPLPVLMETSFLQQTTENGTTNGNESSDTSSSRQAISIALQTEDLPKSEKKESKKSTLESSATAPLGSSTLTTPEAMLLLKLLEKNQDILGPELLKRLGLSTPSTPESPNSAPQSVLKSPGTPTVVKKEKVRFKEDELHDRRRHRSDSSSSLSSPERQQSSSTTSRSRKKTTNGNNMERETCVSKKAHSSRCLPSNPEDGATVSKKLPTSVSHSRLKSRPNNPIMDTKSASTSVIGKTNVTLPKKSTHSDNRLPKKSVSRLKAEPTRSNSPQFCQPGPSTSVNNLLVSPTAISSSNGGNENRRHHRRNRNAEDYSSCSTSSSDSEDDYDFFGIQGRKLGNDLGVRIIPNDKLAQVQARQKDSKNGNNTDCVIS